MNPSAIRLALSQMRERDRDLNAFGAESHGYVLHPVLAESAVKALESEHLVALPEDYRSFLLEVGNGGAGPFYGVFRLGEMDDAFGHGPWPPGFIGMLRAPFPHSAAWNVPPDALTPPDDAGDADLDAFYERLDSRYYDPSVMNGAIPICHRGCALRDWLIVSGPERGTIWHDARADQGGLYPCRDERRDRLTFAEWYANWIEATLRDLGA